MSTRKWGSPEVILEVTYYSSHKHLNLSKSKPQSFSQTQSFIFPKEVAGPFTKKLTPKAEAPTLTPPSSVFPTLPPAPPYNLNNKQIVSIIPLKFLWNLPYSHFCPTLVKTIIFHLDCFIDSYVVSLLPVLILSNPLTTLESGKSLKNKNMKKK